MLKWKMIYMYPINELDILLREHLLSMSDTEERSNPRFLQTKKLFMEN